MKYFIRFCIIYLLMAIVIKSVFGLNLTYGAGFLAVLFLTFLIKYYQKPDFFKRKIAWKEKKNTVKVIIVSSIFFVPILFKYLGLEIYPSVVMPTGIALIPTGTDENLVTLEISSIHAISKMNGDTIMLNVGEFLAPAPAHFFGAFSKNHFGLKNDDIELVEEAKIRWRQKLYSFDCLDSTLIFRKHKTTYPSGKRKKIHEQIYSLY